MIRNHFSLGLHVFYTSSLEILIVLRPLQAGPVWRESTFENFRDGTFEDGGANTYVSTSGRIQMVNRWDINGDSFIDIVFAFSGGYWDYRTTRDREYSSPSRIYWNGPNGFDEMNRTCLYEHGATGNAVADFNNDGHLDFVFSPTMQNRAPDQVQATVIFWGDGSRKYELDQRTVLDQTEGTTQPEIADLNRDGVLDIVSGHSANAGKAVVHYGAGSRSFPVDRRELLPVESSSTCSIADLDQDGWLDLVFPSYKSKGPPVSRATRSSLYLGSPEGFNEERQIRLETNSAAGSLVSDFNQDGYPDVFIYNHRHEGDPERTRLFGDHKTASFLYWGGPQGFNKSRRDLIPGMGVHNDSGVDIGDIYTRRFSYAYISSPQATGGASSGRLSWSGETPHRSSIKFQIRTSDSGAGLTSSLWGGPAALTLTFRRREPAFRFQRMHLGFSTALYWNPTTVHIPQSLKPWRLSSIEAGRPPRRIVYHLRKMPVSYLLTILSVTIAVVAPFSPAEAASTWTEDSFEEFVDGSFPDGGANAYVSAAGRIQIVNRWDLNNDGFLDIVLPSGHGHTEKEDAFLYLNNGKGDIEGRSLIRIPTNGGIDGTIIDFNKDGWNDLAICNNDNGCTYQTDTYVYYGSEKGFSSDWRTILPTVRATALLAEDFNGDGWKDLFIANAWQEDFLEDKGKPASFIYWNSEQGFSNDNRRSFSFESGSVEACTVGDIDSDNRPDLLLCNAGKTLLYASGTKALEDDQPIEIGPAGGTIAIGEVNGDGRKDLAIGGKTEVKILLGGNSGLPTEEMILVEASDPRDILFSDIDIDGDEDLIVANYSLAGGATWAKSYVYLNDNGSYPKEQRIELSTMGASAVSAADLNGDKYPELILSNERVTNQACIPSFVFWNINGTFRNNHHTQLDTQGAVGNAVADVNKDGWPDVVFFNREGNFRDGASQTYVYWGDGTRNYTPQRCLAIPTHYMGGGTLADLDDDGYVDLCTIQGRFISGANEEIFNRVIILWGAKEPFQQRTNLSIDHAGSGIVAVDINRDGYLDLVLGGEATGNDKELKGIAVYWGDPSGFSYLNRGIIPFQKGSGFRVPTVVDLDSDRILDMVTQFENGKLEVFRGQSDGQFSLDLNASLDFGTKDFFGYINPADLNRDGLLDLLLPVRSNGRRTDTPSHVLYARANGFTRENSEDLTTYAGTDASIADLDKDGRLDLVMPSYKDNFKRDVPASIYWGGEKGFTDCKPTPLDTHSSNGTEVADFDGDGWLDILIINHCQDGSTITPGPQNHMTPSYLYWGGPEKFSGTQPTKLPSIGAHAFNPHDLGNAFDRGLYEDYISSAHQVPDTEKPSRLEWKAETPFGTNVKFQLRTSDTQESLKNALWKGPSDSKDWYKTNPAVLTNAEGAWIQYRVRLETPNGAASPLLSSVSIFFE